MDSCNTNRTSLTTKFQCQAGEATHLETRTTLFAASGGSYDRCSRSWASELSEEHPLLTDDQKRSVMRWSGAAGIMWSGTAQSAEKREEREREEGVGDRRRCQKSDAPPWLPGFCKIKRCKAPKQALYCTSMDFIWSLKVSFSSFPNLMKARWKILPRWFQGSVFSVMSKAFKAVGNHSVQVFYKRILSHQFMEFDEEGETINLERGSSGIVYCALISWSPLGHHGDESNPWQRFNFQQAAALNQWWVCTVTSTGQVFISDFFPFTK